MKKAMVVVGVLLAMVSMALAQETNCEPCRGNITIVVTECQSYQFCNCKTTWNDDAHMLKIVCTENGYKKTYRFYEGELEHWEFWKKVNNISMLPK